MHEYAGKENDGKVSRLENAGEDNDVKYTYGKQTIRKLSFCAQYYLHFGFMNSIQSASLKTWST